MRRPLDKALATKRMIALSKALNAQVRAELQTNLTEYSSTVALKTFFGNREFIFEYGAGLYRFGEIDFGGEPYGKCLLYRDEDGPTTRHSLGGELLRCTRFQAASIDFCRMVKNSMGER